ncbi:MAG: Na(+)/H(+) antiporter subunit B [Lentisphaerota bacterium]
MKMTKIVSTTADIFYPFCLIFGFYVVAHGHLTPGGGFQGGAVIATGAALLIVARSFKDISEKLRKNFLKVCESVGLCLFIAAGASGFFLGEPFFSNWLAHAGSIFGTPVALGPNPGSLNTAGLLPIMNVAVGIEVFGGLSIILLYMLSGLSKEKPQ